jgi:hypothetical protein
MDPQVGMPHGKQSPFRWDTSTAAALIALGALAFLVWVNFSVSASASIARR